MSGRFPTPSASADLVSRELKAQARPDGRGRTADASGFASDHVALVKELAQARAQIAEQVAEIARLRLRKPAAAEEHSQARHETSEPR